MFEVDDGGILKVLKVLSLERFHNPTIKLKAIANKDIIHQAQIAEALNDLYVAVDDQKAAMKWLTQARDSYKTLGNKQRVDALDTHLKQLKSTAEVRSQKSEVKRA